MVHFLKFFCIKYLKIEIFYFFFKSIAKVDTLIELYELYVEKNDPSDLVALIVLKIITVVLFSRKFFVTIFFYFNLLVETNITIFSSAEVL